jgi:hypothetical protein
MDSPDKVRLKEAERASRKPTKTNQFSSSKESEK